MPHISKDRLSEEAREKIHQRFIKTITSLKNERKTISFFEELLTETEQEMFSKRLAIIFLLKEGFSFYRIEKLLKVSSSTVARINRDIEKGRFKSITSIFEKKANKEIFWAEFEVLLRLGMPSMGKDRWKWLNEFYSDRSN